MIPKIIHYCWFGGKPLPGKVRKCIASWAKYFPGYEIRQWNESNFDVDAIPYTSEAYRHKKYAFVSDYARFYILYHHGGLYFDTDVEVIRPMDDILAHGAFMGIEHTLSGTGVNPGLGMAAEPQMTLYKEVVDHYAALHFINENGWQTLTTVVKHTTDVLSRSGFIPENRMQQIAGIRIYPNDWFNPLDDATGRLTITENTRSIHHYAKTWVENYGRVRLRTNRLLHRILGIERTSRLRKFLRI